MVTRHSPECLVDISTLKQPHKVPFFHKAALTIRPDLESRKYLQIRDNHQSQVGCIDANVLCCDEAFC